MMGDKGNGLYSVAFGIYGIALTISSYSLPLAVSKMVSARVAKAEYQNMRRVLVSAGLCVDCGNDCDECTLFWSGHIRRIVSQTWVGKAIAGTGADDLYRSAAWRF